jgi:CheY-like chemotaxis protein
MEPSAEACTVLADPGQLEQVVMNLCVNARDAMPQGGDLALHTQRLVIDQEFCALHPWARPGEFVCLTVADSGVGMSAETQARIFEPFFTTKELGRGTGLGLAVVYGIVKQHGGMIHVYSEPERGTAFRVYLPFVNQAVIHRPKEAPRQLVGGTETLLLAEDDRVLRNATAKLLARLGYRIIPVETGREALDTIVALGGEIDLAILDVVMPELNGRTVFDIARGSFPRLRFLFTTWAGFSRWRWRCCTSRTASPTWREPCGGPSRPARPSLCPAPAASPSPAHPTSASRRSSTPWSARTWRS